MSRCNCAETTWHELIKEMEVMFQDVVSTDLGPPQIDKWGSSITVNEIIPRSRNRDPEYFPTVKRRESNSKEPTTYSVATNYGIPIPTEPTLNHCLPPRTLAVCLVTK